VSQKVAVLNTSLDTLEGFALALGDAGFHPTTLCTVGRSRDQLTQFIGQVDPDIVVYDIAPPYGESIRHWDELRKTQIVQGKPFVLTTTGRALELGTFGDPHTEVLEKPFSFERLVRAVRRSIRRAKEK
jgi:DNA-binding response OmpR family regulator